MSSSNEDCDKTGGRVSVDSVFAKNQLDSFGRGFGESFGGFQETSFGTPGASLSFTQYLGESMDRISGYHDISGGLSGLFANLSIQKVQDLFGRSETAPIRWDDVVKESSKPRYEVGGMLKEAAILYFSESESEEEMEESLDESISREVEMEESGYASEAHLVPGEILTQEPEYVEVDIISEEVPEIVAEVVVEVPDGVSETKVEEEIVFVEVLEDIQEEAAEEAPEIEESVAVDISGVAEPRKITYKAIDMIKIRDGACAKGASMTHTDVHALQKLSSLIGEFRERPIVGYKQPASGVVYGGFARKSHENQSWRSQHARINMASIAKGDLFAPKAVSKLNKGHQTESDKAIGDILGWFNKVSVNNIRECADKIIEILVSQVYVLNMSQDRLKDLDDQQLEEVENKKENAREVIRRFVDTVFGKAIQEPQLSYIYADMCNSVISSGRIAQSEYADGEGNIYSKSPIEVGVIEKCKNTLEDESWYSKPNEKLVGADIEERLMKKNNAIGNIIFIGHLVKLEIISLEYIEECIKRLIFDNDNPEGEDIECCCKLLTVCKDQFDKGDSKHTVQDYLEKIKEIGKKKEKTKELSSRVKFMIMDLDDLINERREPEKEEPKQTRIGIRKPMYSTGIGRKFQLQKKKEVSEPNEDQLREIVSCIMEGPPTHLAVIDELEDMDISKNIKDLVVLETMLFKIIEKFKNAGAKGLDKIWLPLFYVLKELLNQDGKKFQMHDIAAVLRGVFSKVVADKENWDKDSPALGGVVSVVVLNLLSSLCICDKEFENSELLIAELKHMGNDKNFEKKIEIAKNNPKHVDMRQFSSHANVTRTEIFSKGLITKEQSERYIAK